MSERTISIIMCVLFSFIMAGYSTTSILRLTIDSKPNIKTIGCYCEKCGIRIPLYRQAPIFSYLLSGGRCFNCKNKISKGHFILEIIIFFSFIVIGIASSFKYVSYFIQICFFEVTKIVSIIIIKKKETSFIPQFLLSIVCDIIVTFGFLFLHVLIIIFF